MTLLQFSLSNRNLSITGHDSLLGLLAGSLEMASGPAGSGRELDTLGSLNVLRVTNVHP